MPIDLGNIPTGTPPTTGEKLQIRTAIGLGQTDAPTFLAQTLTGQSLTGTQATSLVDLATTWLSTTGTPTAIKLNVTDTANVPAASLLMDLQVGGASYLKVAKDATTTWRLNAGGTSQIMFKSGNTPNLDVVQSTGLKSVLGPLDLRFNTGASPANPAILTADGADILAQRNGLLAQAFRVYSSYYGTTQNEWFEIDWKTTSNTVRLFTMHGGTGAVKSMDISAGATLYLGAGSSSPIRMYSGGVERWQISAAGDLLAVANNAYDIGAFAGNRPRNVYVANAITANSIGGASGADLLFNGASVGAAWKLTPAGNIVTQVDGIYDIGASGANRPKNIYIAGEFISTGSITTSTTQAFVISNRLRIASTGSGLAQLSNAASTDFDRLQLGGTSAAFPAIKRNGTGIDIRLADDSAFAPVKGKITTDTNYTVGAFSPTGFLTLYDATGTAYKVACSVYP